jgi:purine-nucleoside phosphorylase
VVGHAGTVGIGRVAARRVVVVEGRAHLYEGNDLGAAQFAVRVLAHWGVRSVIVTNASGSLRSDIVAGSVVRAGRLLDLQVPGLLGVAEQGPEEIVLDADPEPAGALPAVTYSAVPGPQYETAAEVAVLRSMGADVVGMSAAAEVRAARDEGLRVAILSVVTNAAGEADPTGAGGGLSGHEGVLAAGRTALPSLRGALAAVVTCWEPGA